MQEHHIAVARTARYFTLGEGGPSAKQVWFVCHGYGQLAERFLRHFAGLDDGRRLIVAPEGLSRFYLESGRSESGRSDKVGASWMTREDRLNEIQDYVRYLDEVYAAVFRRIDRATARVGVLGFSQGAATATRWVCQGAARADRLMLWGGELPPDLDLAAAAERLRTLELCLVYGRRDGFITAKVVAQAEQRLRECGIAFRTIPFDGGHEVDEALLARLAG